MPQHHEVLCVVCCIVRVNTCACQQNPKLCEQCVARTRLLCVSSGHTKSKCSSPCGDVLCQDDHQVPEHVVWCCPLMLCISDNPTPHMLCSVVRGVVKNTLCCVGCVLTHKRNGTAVVNLAALC